jgi:predicted nucleotidyltransferase
MATGTAAPIEQRLALMAADIRRLIPAAEVRLFGSRARGQTRHDSDVDLLVTAPDAWLA